MSDHETHGDESTIACPWCGKPITELWDYGSVFEEGGSTIECGHCERPVAVTVRVEYESTAKRAGPGT